MTYIWRSQIMLAVFVQVLDEITSFWHETTATLEFLLLDDQTLQNGLGFEGVSVVCITFTAEWDIIVHLLLWEILWLFIAFR